MKRDLLAPLIFIMGVQTSEVFIICMTRRRDYPRKHKDPEVFWKHPLNTWRKP